MLVPPYGPDLADRLRDLASRSFAPHLQDDRFDLGFLTDPATQPSFRGVIEHKADSSLISDPRLSAYLGGFIDGSSLHLDALVESPLERPEVVLAKMLRFFVAELQDRPEALNITLWTKPTFDWHDDFAASCGLVQDRALLQMRAALPSNIAPLETRAFVPGVDNEALRIVNNRAFASHPDQGNQSPAQFDEALAQDWVNPDGIRLFEIDGTLAGFCWTKVHRNPDLGEIYVIGVDPTFHGQGLGKPMTAAGLNWLSDQGLETSMLYVEANNTAALLTYERLGFEVVRTDKSWIVPSDLGTQSPTDEHSSASDA